MSMDVHITLSDSDLEQFAAAVKASKSPHGTPDGTTTVAAARKALHEIKLGDLPEFISTRLKAVETMVAMLEDTGFGLPDQDRANVLAALSYFVSTDDAIADDMPIMGFLDDAIMIELCTRELAPELEAYNDFHVWRDAEARRRGEDPTKVALTRAEWAETRRLETIARMHRQRQESYSRNSRPSILFRVH